MKIKNIIPIALSLGLIVGAIGLVDMLEPEPTQAVTHEKEKQPVSVTLVSPQAHQPVISLIGTSDARWPVEIKAPSSAKLVWLSKNAEPGVLVEKGEVLAKIDTTHLESQLAQAETLMKQAALNLQREQHEQTVALKMLSNKNSSAYARREPQIAAAKSELKQAKQAVISAQQHLNDATIKAPFNAVILSRAISPEQQLESGDILFTLASSDSLDIHVPIPEPQWNIISTALKTPKIQVIDKQQKEHIATVRYIAPRVDSTTRQRQVVLTVEDPYRTTPKLLPNQQLDIEVTLAMREAVMEVPLSALTRDGHIWTVDSEDKLRIETIQLLEENVNSAYVIFNHSPERARNIVAYPLLSMISGTQVSPESALETAPESVPQTALDSDPENVASIAYNMEESQ
ncbi:efflux RND transporter periplasmic adaptor subunit [Vibrio sp. 99-70-13A1]|uniref:efflux RND transporter periplasmic adaptor subunit n=1 Tax=Vibrio sp. 99-70-13A1 TaxID=2607601 RepID=UPI0014938239|nr:efflux RND transporter periplasmic adaptor subunit [Vibrio sp. 99-70-13A1]NOH97390.1 efflux RND transporter periplasmic adaptor subunit [Vibrio sp. 99-70-13A1]